MFTVMDEVMAAAHQLNSRNSEALYEPSLKGVHEMSDSTNDVPRPLHEGMIYLNSHHKKKLKEEFGVEAWSFDQHLGVAVFILARCPFQMRNLHQRLS
ncbi:unnamed protein product [Lactuca virosa]|uniref:Uncharacterized protein n=1 Tax=Lactuca virosa TaxID=75947 RepID=A0AAU9PD23_9ASTR|nr:unnamed protein product [Lactuca virosa]